MLQGIGTFVDAALVCVAPLAARIRAPLRGFSIIACFGSGPGPVRASGRGRGCGVQETLISQGVTLMLAGMGTVFAFLALLVAAMTLTSWLLARTQNLAGGAGDEEVAAIGAAVARHRSRH